MKCSELKISVAPCPICGMSDALDITDKTIFKKVLEDPGCIGSVVSIECKRCDLELKQYDHPQETKWLARVKTLVGKWNAMPREEDVDDGK